MTQGFERLTEPTPEARDFYVQTLTSLNARGMPYLVGGAYALRRYTGIERHTKDLDLFLRAQDLEAMLGAVAELGCRTEVTFPHWLAKAYRADLFFDLIFSSGNGLATVEDDWFEHGVDDAVFGVPVRLVSAEEMIWQKVFVMERERFDGADVAHLLRARAADLDWGRLLGRFETVHARVLMAHLLLFGYIYPDARESIPEYVLRELNARLANEPAPEPSGARICRGTLLSRAQYLPDIDWWGYRDARLPPGGRMTPEEIAHWTAAIDRS